MHQDVFEIETESNKVTAWSTNKIPLPFHCHVVTFPPISEILENKQALHYHNVFEIHYVVEGTLYSTVNQVDYQTKQGDILVICPNDVHANHFVDKKTVTFRIMIDNDYLISLGLSFEGLMIQPQIIGDQTLSGYMNAMYLDSIQEGINNYLKPDMIENPILSIEAIGFLKACKIVMPENAGTYDKMIDNILILLLATISE